jgi:hypothetical protein
MHPVEGGVSQKTAISRFIGDHVRANGTATGRRTTVHQRLTAAFPPPAHRHGVRRW